MLENYFENYAILGFYLLVAITVPIGMITLSKLAQFIKVRPSNPSELKELGTNRFKETDKSGVPLIGSGDEDGFGKFQAGSIESSNTDVSNELTTMIKAQQLFSGASRLLQTEVEMVRSIMG